MLHLLAFADHRRIIIHPLAGQDFPIIKTGRIGFQVPFADHGGLIAGLLEQLWKGGLETIKPTVAVVVKAVDMTVSAGEERGATGAAQRVVHQKPIEPHAFVCQPVNVRCLDQMPRFIVSADRLPRVVIGEYKQNIRPTGCLTETWQTDRQTDAYGKRQQNEFASE